MLKTFNHRLKVFFLHYTLDLFFVLHLNLQPHKRINTID
jgi:hypothetical protein